MYTEFIIIYIGMIILALLNITTIVILVKFLKNANVNKCSNNNFTSAKSHATKGGSVGVVFCNKCGTRFDGATRICPKCGTPK